MPSGHHDSIHRLLPQACGDGQANANSSGLSSPIACSSKGSVNSFSPSTAVGGVPPPLLFAVPCGGGGQPGATTAADNDDVRSTQSGNGILNIDTRPTTPSPRADDSKFDGAAVDCGGGKRGSNWVKVSSCSLACSLTYLQSAFPRGPSAVLCRTVPAALQPARCSMKLFAHASWGICRSPPTRPTRPESEK